jgi:hypothetical protein
MAMIRRFFPVIQAVHTAQTRLQARPWTDLALPDELHAGVFDPRYPLSRSFPSPYQVPMGVRAVQTPDAWKMDWRYLDPNESVRRVAMALWVWACVGRHSGRLLALEGVGWPEVERIRLYFQQWHAQAAEESCSHRQVMRLLWPTAEVCLTACRTLPHAEA